MDTHEAAGAILVAAVVAANLPFLSGRVLMIGPRRGAQGLGPRLLEWVLLGCGAWGIGLLLEARIGQVHPQGWAFYVAMACFHLTLAFPGLVWCCLRQRPVDPGRLA